MIVSQPICTIKKEQGEEMATIEEVRERTREAFGITEKIPSVWNNVCVCHLAIKREITLKPMSRHFCGLLNSLSITAILKNSGRRGRDELCI